MAFRFIGLILLPWALQPGGGQQLTQLRGPILVTLARRPLHLACEISYLYTSAFKEYTFSYYHIDLKGKQSPSTLASCIRTPGVENKTHTETCSFILTSLHNSSATGTYYCQVKWSSFEEKDRGIFVLVLDAGYKEPPESSKKLLLCIFISLLAILSILGTDLLFWKAKKQRRSVKKIPHLKDPGPSRGSADSNPDRAGSIYTALQTHQPEVYDCLQSNISITPSKGSPPTQCLLKKQHLTGEEFNAIYENF